MKMKTTTLVLVLLFASSPAIAQDRGQGWSVLSGKTVGSGTTVLHPELGWPGIGISLLHGLRSNFDLGGKFTFNYGYEGITNGVIPGVKVQGLLRINFVQRGRFNFGLKLAPGPLFYFQNNGRARIGITIPAHFAFGIAVGSAVMLNFGIDLPMFVQFNGGPTITRPAGLYFPILFGAGLEYFIDRNMALTANLRMGPTILPGGAATFTFESLFGLAFRL